MVQFPADSEESRPQEEETEIYQKTTGAISLIAIPVHHLQTQTTLCVPPITLAHITFFPRETTFERVPLQSPDA